MAGVLDLEAEQIIQCVEKYPVLYDSKFQRSIKRRQAWIDVAKELNHEVSLVQKKWKNMRDEYVKVRKGTSKSQYGPEYHLQMKFMDPHLPSVVSLLSSKSSIRGEKRNNNDDEETDSQSDDDQFDSTRTSASLKSVDKMNGLDLILLGISKLMETYPQELSEVQSSMDEVDEICSLITKVIKQYAQSEPHLASPSISKFLMEQLANNGPLNQIENRVRARPSKVRKLTVRVKKELW